MGNRMKDYKERLEKELELYADKPMTFRAIQEISCICECIEHLSELECEEDDYIDEKISAKDIKHWNSTMKNEDGTTGGHWTVEQTTPLAGTAIENINADEWNVTMNMIYSDYCKVAEKHGTNKVDWYVDMAKAFLFDRDGGSPHKKLERYYKYIANK